MSNLDRTSQALSQRMFQEAPPAPVDFLEMAEAIITAALLPIEEKYSPLLDPVAHDAARKFIQGGNYAIISPSRNMLITRADYEPSSRDTALDLKEKEKTKRDHIRNQMLRQELAKHLGSRYPQHLSLAQVHEVYNSGQEHALLQHLQLAGHEFVTTTGGYREAGSPLVRGHIPTEASFIVRTGKQFPLPEAARIGHHFGQESIIYSGEETGHKPTLVPMHYHDVTQERDLKNPFHVEPWSFDPTRVRAVFPPEAHVHSQRGLEVAFTHHWHPGMAYPHHLPPSHLTRPAWKFVGATDPKSRFDLPN